MTEKTNESGKKKIRKELFIYGLVVLSVLVLVAGVLENARRQKYDGVRINLAGRQRMLTQKISKNLLLYASGKISGPRLNTDIKIFHTTLQTLTNGGEAPVDMEMTTFRTLPPMDIPEIKVLLEAALNKWNILNSTIDTFLQDKTNGDVAVIIESYEALLNDIDHIVFFLQKEAEDKTHTGRLIAYAGLALLVLSVLLLLVLKINANKRELKTVQEHIEKLETLLPICSHCKKIRLDDKDPEVMESWVSVEKYFSGKQEVIFSHGMCPDCVEQLYPEMADKLLGREKKKAPQTEN
ncbi:MAG: hypothetical protein GY757_49760 [bacterium]|nr:hypothetical protein [bacterium]